MKKPNIFISLLLILCLITGCNIDSPPSQSQEIKLAASETESISSELKVHFVNIGQGDCSLIILPSSKTILIDAGNNQYGNAVVSYLQ